MCDGGHGLGEERLWKMLAEDLESAEEADEMLSTMETLRQWYTPQPTEEATASLVATLTEAMAPEPMRWYQRVMNWWPLLLLRSQARVVRGEIWIASTLVMLLGTVVTIANDQPQNMLPLVLLAPLVSAFGVGMLYDSDVALMLELEDTTRASARVLLLARLTLVFGFNLILGVAGSVALVAFQAESSLWPLVISWLVPMTFLSALAFLLSVVFVDALMGGLVGLILWGMHVVLRSAAAQNDFIYLLSLPGLAAPENRSVLLSVSLLLLVLAVWLIGTLERRVGGRQ